MKTKQAQSIGEQSPRDQIFSHPIRKLNADELEKVVGGWGSLPGIKGGGGVDNQGKDFG